MGHWVLVLRLIARHVFTAAALPPPLPGQSVSQPPATTDADAAQSSQTSQLLAELLAEVAALRRAVAALQPAASLPVAAAPPSQ